MSNSQPSPRIPNVGDDPREQSPVDDPQGKTWFRDLDEAVIEADRCIQCGSCVAACPSDSLGVDDAEDKPTLVSMCTGCSRCWDFCPRSGMRYERLIELEAAERAPEAGGMYAARASEDAIQDEAQDGGVVTALLSSLIEQEVIDGALVATDSAGESLKGEAYLATSPDDLLANAGSSYNQTMQLGHLHSLLAEADIDDPDIALVGTPCVIQGATALERYEWDDEAASIELTVALMCTRNFAYDRLNGLLEGYGVDPAAVDRLDVTDGNVYALDADGETLLVEPVDAFDAAALDGCAECADFLGETADLSAGSVGSEDGHTTVAVRTERGENAWEHAHSALETTQLEPTETLDKLADWNRRRATAVLPRPFDPEGSLSIDYDAHREAFDDTDRAPAPLNPARVYQYEEWC